MRGPARSHRTSTTLSTSLDGPRIGREPGASASLVLGSARRAQWPGMGVNSGRTIGRMSRAGQAGPAGAPVLISTKLHVPRMRSGMVSRPHLIVRLVRAREHKLVLLCAPAGWGKTTLLSEWLASPEEPRPCAWVSLDAADGDPSRFWSYVIGALREVRPDVGEAALAALPAGGRCWATRSSRRLPRSRRGG
jgi:hypothetical protein